MSPLLAAVLAVSSASLSDAPPRWATLDGHRIHYKVLGSGPRTVVFVHGWTGSLEMWRLQAPFFAAKGFRVLALDLPGHGGSDAPQVSYTMPLFARAVDAVMRDAGVASAVLVGHSMGTPVVREFYRRHPEKTRALVSVDGSLRALFTPEEADRILIPYRGPGYTKQLEKFADFMIPADQPALRAEAKAIMTKTPQRVAISAFENLADPTNFREDPIRVPLLCVLAKGSHWPSDYEAFVRRLAPTAEYRVLDDGVGHFLMLQKPAEFNAILSEFLDGLRDDPGQ
ncbi:MAG TPA: alpha/beta hydrolase [Thermoanaerobaculia bacterium]|jgi:pimeloyl-ACP methyl ester carboxylesterase